MAASLTISSFHSLAALSFFQQHHLTSPKFLFSNLSISLLSLHLQTHILKPISILQNNFHLIRISTRVKLPDKDLTGKTVEIGKLNFTISALKAEINDLQEIIRQGNMEIKQLDMAKQLIKELQRKNSNGSQIKGQIILLEEQLSRFTAIETSIGDALSEALLLVASVDVMGDGDGWRVWTVNAMGFGV
ncbi:hypothetical protein PVK06_031924 [Gossypium arboreum]|uniref:Uncharacterized protein n=1 Tax=Gossypium arboreum TaxID=29729 RepID=A0ABR0NSH3_GOSAR|nr:hypothetical protein PVK06_031924 [Gossypium arboreum]